MNRLPLDPGAIANRPAVAADAGRSAPNHGRWLPATAAQPRGVVAWAGTVLVVGVCTALAAAMRAHFDLSNLAMVYLLGVVVSAVAYGRAPAVFAALLSVALFDYVFVPPRFTLRVSDTQYLVTLAVMLVVALVTGTLAAWLRDQLEAARLRERRTAAHYRLSHDLAARSRATDVLEVAVHHASDVLDTSAAALVPDAEGRMHVVAGDAALFGRAKAELVAAQWAFEHGEIAGLDGQRFAGAAALHLPLRAAAETLGVLAVDMAPVRRPSDPDPLGLLRAFASQAGLALERCRLAGQADVARADAEAERARNALLSSVSHDLRTPLAAIEGAATSLRDDDGALTESTRRELAGMISEETRRLNRLIGNLLDMTRLESGAVHVRTSWHSIEEVVGAALNRLDSALGSRPVRVRIPDDLPLIPLDDVLFEQVIWNLVENANKYTPPGGAIEILAAIEDGVLMFEVNDEGPGLGSGDASRMFEKFQRGPAGAAVPGVGLGLAICRGIVLAHAGSIEAEDRPTGGATVRVRLPLAGPPPDVRREADSARATDA